MFISKYIKNKNILYITISLLFFITINISNIFYYLKSEYIPGWDGLGHVAFSYVYHQDIFPATHGSIDVWFNKVPFPNFYPPLFYFITSLFAFVGSQELFFDIFKIFNVSMILIGIVGFYFLSLTFIKSKEKALVTTILYTLIISTYGKFGGLGITIESVFNYGFLPQAFSFIFFIIFLNFFNKKNTVANKVIYMISLLCVALSNIHTLFITVVYILIHFLYLLFTKDFTELKNKIIDCFWAGMISLFWFLPMLYYYDFSGAKTSNYQFTHIYLLICLLFSLVTFIVAYKERNKTIAILSLFILSLSSLNYIPVKSLIFAIPLHFERWVIIPILLSPILYIYLIGKNKIFKTLAVFGLLYIFSSYLLSVNNQNDRGYFSMIDKKEFEYMIDWIVENHDDKDTLISIESAYVDDMHDFWYMHALLGMNNVKTSYSILRESSSMVFAFATIRNSISAVQESIGIKFNVRNQNTRGNHFIKQGVDIGITHFLAKTQFAKKIMDQDENIILIKEFKDWNLYEAVEPAKKIVDSDLKAILTYTDFNLKKNTDNSFDLTRLAEELIYNDKLDLIFYQSTEKDLSQEVEYLSSSGVFIPQYEYSDLEKAYENIIKISQHRPVYLLTDINNELFNKIYSNRYENKNIYFLENKSYEINSNLSHMYFKNIFNFIDTRSKDFKSNSFRYIKESYFPDIKSENKRYIATPFYILESKLEKNQERFDIFKYSKYISLISIIVSAIYFTYIYRKES